jgi:hypothetical protein
MQETPNQTEANDFDQEMTGQCLEVLVAHFRGQALIEEIQDKWQQKK